MESDYIELAVLTAVLKDGIEDAFPGQVWVKAEISGLSHKQNGHCYLDLSQSRKGSVVAKVKGTVWASRWNYIDQYFRSVTGSSLGVGMEVLLLAQVNFHPVFGLSLNIDEVDPEFTLGAKERQKQLTIERLSREGLLDLQKGLSLPLLPYSLAVISAPGAAGLGDFLRHLNDNEYGFVFDVDFFEALMQGDQAADSMIIALESIQSSDKAHDAVLILRGGGSELDLACFDDYALAAAIARCPIPVFTAIGHEKDYHVADMVANTFVKTPTALADLFLECFMDEDSRLTSYESRVRIAFAGRCVALESNLSHMETRVGHAADLRVRDASHKLDLLESRLFSADPRRILEKGFVLALDRRGVRMNSVLAAKVGDPARILFSDGTLDVTVTDISMNEDAGPPGP